jgi:hypothetical protein
MGNVFPQKLVMSTPRRLLLQTGSPFSQFCSWDVNRFDVGVLLKIVFFFLLDTSQPLLKLPMDSNSGHYQCDQIKIAHLIWAGRTNL